MPIDVREPRSLPHGADRRFLDEVRFGYDAPIAKPVFTIGEQGEEGASIRRVRIEAVDRREARFEERLWAYIIISDDENGAPGGGQAVTVVTGTLLQEIVAGQVLQVETNGAGVIELDVDEDDAATLYIRCAYWCLPYESEPLDFDATVVTNGTPIGLLLALTRV